MYITVEIDQEESRLGRQDYCAAVEAVEQAIATNPGIHVLSGARTSTKVTFTLELTPAFFLTMMLWAKLPDHLAETMRWRTGDQGHRLTLRKDEGS
jgi:hypothetical protein